MKIAVLALLGVVLTVAGVALYATTGAPYAGLVTFAGTACLAISAWTLHTRKNRKETK